MRGEAPVIMDIRSETQWLTHFGTVLSDLEALVGTDTFRQVDRELIDRLRRQAESRHVLAVIGSRTGYVHGDLSADNVFLSTDGYKVIDWQRPIRGPVELDLASLLESQGFGPSGYVTPGVMPLMYLLRVAWFAECARHWFPVGAETYDTEIVRLAAGLQELFG